MSRIAILVAALALTVVVVSPAAAGGAPVTVTITATCDTGTGEYAVSYDVLNISPGPGDLSVLTYEVDGAPATAPTFSPNPVPGNNGTSSAANTVPGTTTSIFIEIEVDFAVALITISDTETLAGDCVAATTTTASTTTTSTTTTTTVAPAVAATPAFTG